MSKPVVISCDSACDLSPELRARYGIEITHMYVQLDGQVYRDGVNIAPEDIYTAFAEKGVLPSTSAIPPQEYSDFFRRYTNAGCAVVHIALSSALSSTCQDAMIAASELEDVYVVDSLALSCSGGLLAVQAARMRQQGKSGEEIYYALLGLRKRTNTSFIVGSLTFLSKGGRCSTATAMGANLLGIKPAVEMADGSLSVGKKYRGKTADCFEKFLKDKLALAAENSDGGTACIYHAGIDEAMFEKLYETVCASGVFAEVLTARAGSIISSHCGQETIGFTYQTK